FEVEFVRVGERTHIQVEIVMVLGAEVEARRAGRTLGITGTRLEVAVETEVRGQMECSVVIGVVAVADVAHGSLRRSGFQRGMRIHQAESGEEAWIGNPPNPD